MGWECEEFSGSVLILFERFCVRFGSLNVGNLCGRGTEVCEELRSKRVDVCSIQEVSWKGQGARIIGVKQRRYKLWWSGNDSGIGGVGILRRNYARRLSRYEERVTG